MTAAAAPARRPRRLVPLSNSALVSAARMRGAFDCFAALAPDYAPKWHRRSLFDGPPDGGPHVVRLVGGLAFLEDAAAVRRADRARRC